jgi:hypothetical protein
MFSSGRVLVDKTVMELPLMGNSAMLLVKITPGIQSGGVNNYLALHSNAGGSDYNVDGNVGGNAWTLDGSPNSGPGRRTAYLPYSDAVSEFKVETNNFDAGIGQTSGAAITMISKSGTNALHGTATWQHWQQRWQGTSFFVKQQYYQKINAAGAAGNHALAQSLRATDKQPTGRSNNWGASAGGPLVIHLMFGGWQAAATYEFQPGPLLDWGAVNNNGNNMSKNLHFTEWLNMQLRFDALNLTNRSQMAGPSTDPLSTNFGKVTSQTAATNRWLQVQARIQF